MKSKVTAAALLFAAMATSATAAPVACPDLAAAVQVATCPSDEELKYTYSVYCSENARMYDKDTVTCTGLEHYRRLKNIVLWESADGAFSGYLSCDLPTATIKAAKPTAIAVTKAGAMTRLVCSYGDGIALAHRTRAKCTPVAEADKCAADPAACKADCE